MKGAAKSNYNFTVNSFQHEHRPKENTRRIPKTAISFHDTENFPNARFSFSPIRCKKGHPFEEE